MINELKESFGHLFEDALLAEISEVGVFKKVLAGDILIDIGSYVRYIPLLLSGAIKILREDDEGDELLLYFLEKGDTCAVTLSCCLGQTKSDIRAVAEVDTKLIMIPIQKMEDWITTYKSWRDFAFQSYQNRLQEMLIAIDGIAFLNLDERLLKYIHEKANINQGNEIQTTHQEIAYELHTSRVVISRLLKKLEKLGKIELHRNNIKVLEK
ncbi:MAG: CRP/FNR family transcriptional regulator [Sediminicola sp.]|jgi:CRP/FNR family transcriptional regulator|tara:strand:- start:36 stop:668 length:633 start_codon:yes stop_codon:yes gene_type:complete